LTVRNLHSLHRAAFPAHPAPLLQETDYDGCSSIAPLAGNFHVADGGTYASLDRARFAVTDSTPARRAEHIRAKLAEKLQTLELLERELRSAQDLRERVRRRRDRCRNRSRAPSDRRTRVDQQGLRHRGARSSRRSARHRRHGAWPAAPVPTATTAAATTWAPAPRSKTTGCLSQGGLPDPDGNPHAIDPPVNPADLTSTICHAGYTKTVRPAESVTQRIKRDQVAACGFQDLHLGDYGLDHLISLELDGAPQDVANLWPEPWSGDGYAHQKDAVENYLHDHVCRGAMQLVDAQRAIATDWPSMSCNRSLQPAAATPTD
jgi:hypothetical protein